MLHTEKECGWHTNTQTHKHTSDHAYKYASSCESYKPSLAEKFGIWCETSNGAGTLFVIFPTPTMWRQQQYSIVVMTWLLLKDIN